MFNKCFTEASTIDDANATLPDCNRIFCDNRDLSLIIVKQDDVRDQIKILNVNKSYGSDGILPKLLAEGGETVVKTLTILFNLSHFIKKVPMIWKQTYVIQKEIGCK